jgi:hypothetical protein
MSRSFDQAREDWDGVFINTHAPDWDRYALGYRVAAERLLDALGQPNQGQEYLILPLLFLYRHALELTLKWIIDMAHEHLQRPRDPKALANHRIVDLWQKAEALLTELWPGAPPPSHSKIANCLRQFSDHDPGSDAFRYPVRTDGSPNLEELHEVDLRIFEKTVTETLDMLEGIAAQLDEPLTAMRGG